ncbi:heme-binding protein [Sphingomonas sp. SUN039]|uniref:GlcG/HbpS family heme-binding protein n=1 Tax=Sphingomonas sp. SUN039 TaxID=2937787 RepID=UPI00216460CD|nr:heme-binding protein [Sphingomonas sp. SUN039]UVO52685.1 heme-binding protein [Sphingomonas sp. SUN039]
MIRMAIAASVLAGCAIPATVLAQTAAAGANPGAPAPAVRLTRYGLAISVDDALALIGRARAFATEKSMSMAFAVVDPSGELIAFARMEDAPYASIRLAQQKARTAARLRVSTATLQERVTAGEVRLMSSDEVIAIGGGVPIIVNGRVVGALGVSGGTAAEDAALAAAATR